MAGKTLTDWMGDQTPKGDTIEGWFTARPDLREQAIAGKQAGFSGTQITAWLADEHGFPFRSGTLLKWLAQ